MKKRKKKSGLEEREEQCKLGTLLVVIFNRVCCICFKVFKVRKKTNVAVNQLCVGVSKGEVGYFNINITLTAKTKPEVLVEFDRHYLIHYTSV
jgi:hypothetical protein